MVDPHLNIGPIPGINVFELFLILGSSTRCEFAVGSVRCLHGPIAVSLFKPVGLDWSCYDGAGIAFYGPLCFVSNWSTVNVGFTKGDLAASLACVAYDSLKQVIISLILKKGGEAIVKTKIFKTLVKPNLMATMRSAGFTMVFNQRQGFLNELLNKGPVRFTSMADELTKNMISLVGGKVADSVIGLTNIDAAVTGPDGLANRLGALIDGNSEALGY